jgi:hypothetical protein
MRLLGVAGVAQVGRRAMPTTLPDTAARARPQRPRVRAELVPLVAAIVYLAVLGWDMAELGTSFSLLFGHDQRQGEYNPMEPGHPIAERRAAARGAR